MAELNDSGYLYLVIPRRYERVYEQLLVKMSEYGEDLLKDCSSTCKGANKSIMTCWIMFQSACAAYIQGENKKANLFINYICCVLGIDNTEVTDNCEYTILVEGDTETYESKLNLILHTFDENGEEISAKYLINGDAINYELDENNLTIYGIDTDVHKITIMSILDGVIVAHKDIEYKFNESEIKPEPPEIPDEPEEPIVYSIVINNKDIDLNTGEEIIIDDIDTFNISCKLIDSNKPDKSIPCYIIPVVIGEPYITADNEYVDVIKNDPSNLNIIRVDKIKGGIASNIITFKAYLTKEDYFNDNIIATKSIEVQFSERILDDKKYVTTIDELANGVISTTNGSVTLTPRTTVDGESIIVDSSNYRCYSSNRNVEVQYNPDKTITINSIGDYDGDAVFRFDTIIENEEVHSFTFRVSFVVEHAPEIHHIRYGIPNIEFSYDDDIDANGGSISPTIIISQDSTAIYTDGSEGETIISKYTINDSDDDDIMILPEELYSFTSINGTVDKVTGVVTAGPTNYTSRRGVASVKFNVILNNVSNNKTVIAYQTGASESQPTFVGYEYGTPVIDFKYDDEDAPVEGGKFTPIIKITQTKTAKYSDGSTRKENDIVYDKLSQLGTDDYSFEIEEYGETITNLDTNTGILIATENVHINRVLIAKVKMNVNINGKSNFKTISFYQEASEELIIVNYRYSKPEITVMYGNAPYRGGSIVPLVSIVQNKYPIYNNNTEGTPEKITYNSITELPVASITFESNDVNVVRHTGIVSVGETSNTSITTIGTVTVTVTINNQTSSKDFDIKQNAATKVFDHYEYGDITINTFSYDDVPATGGVVTPNIKVTQAKFNVYNDGSKIATEPDVYNELSELPEGSYMITSNNSYMNLNNGALSVSSTTSTARSKKADVTINITINDKSKQASTSIWQAAITMTYDYYYGMMDGKTSAFASKTIKELFDNATSKAITTNSNIEVTANKQIFYVIVPTNKLTFSNFKMQNPGTPDKMDISNNVNYNETNTITKDGVSYNIYAYRSAGVNEASPLIYHFTLTKK